MNISLIGVLNKTIECAHADGFVPYMQIAARERDCAHCLSFRNAAAAAD